MKVSSPIGDLPFEPQHLSVKNGALEITGQMGAWPAHVHIDIGDVPAMSRLLAKPAAVMLTSAVAALGLARLINSRHYTPKGNGSA